MYPGDIPISVHPGEVLQEMLDERGLTQLALARHLSTDAARINEICRGRRAVSAQMAVLFAKAFGTSAALWLNLQSSWDLSRVDRTLAKRVRPLRASTRGRRGTVPAAR